MPQVPSYDGPQINYQGAPGVRVSTDAPLEAFGGGATQAAVGQAGVGLGNEITKIGDQEQQKANDSVAIDAYAKTMAYKQNLLYDPNDGALNKRGKDAFGITQDYGSQFDKFADDVSKSMTPDQLEAYQKIRVQQKDDLTGTLEKHTFTEAQNYQDEVTKSGISANRDEAVLNYQDTDKVNQAIDMQKNLVLHNAQMKGLGTDSDMVKQQLEAVTSDTNQAVINRMLSNQQDMAAKAYYDSKKDIPGQFSGADKATLEKTLEEGSLRGESQRFVDQMESQKLSPDQAMEKIKTIDDPQLRDKVNERYKNDQLEAKRLTEDRQVQLYQGAYNTMTQAKSLDAIPPNVMLSLTPAQQNELKSSYKTMMEGVPVKTDLPTYYKLDDNKVLQNTNLLEYASKLSPTDFEKLADRQKDIKAGKTDKVDGFESDKDAVNSVLKTAGISIDPKNSDYIAARSAIDSAVIAQKQATGKSFLNNDELRTIAKQQTIKHITDNGLLWNTTKRAYQLSPEDQSSTPVVVPDAESAQITKALKARNLPTTQENISKYYLKGIQSGR